MNRNTLPSNISKHISRGQQQSPTIYAYPKYSQLIKQQSHEDMKEQDSKIQTQSKSMSKGIIYILISCFSIILMQMCVKNLSKHFSSFLILGIRGTLLFLLNSVFIFRKKLDYNIRRSDVYQLIVLRSFLSSIVVTLYLGSLKYLPIGVLNTLFNTAPILTIFTEALILKKQRIHCFHIIVTILSFVGVAFIIQPQFLFGENEKIIIDIPHYLIVLLAALFSSFSIVFMTKLKGKCDQLVTLQYGYFIQSFLNFIMYLFFHSQQNQSIQYLQRLDIADYFQMAVYISLMTVMAFCTTYLRVKTFYLTSPAMVLPFSYFTVLLGLAVDIFWYEAEYNLFMILGIGLTSMGLFSKLIALKLSQTQ